MSVKFVFDEFNLSSDEDFDIVVNSKFSSVASARSSIVQFLASGESRNLLVLLKSRAVLNRIEDLLASKGVAPLQTLNPRQLLNDKLGFEPPPWLFDSAIAKLNLLTKENLNIEQRFFLRDLLKSVDFELFKIKELKDFMFYIRSKPELFSLFLQFPPFKTELEKYFELEQKVEKNAIAELVNTLDDNDNLIDNIHLISYNQAIYLLKNIAIKYSIPFSSPPLEVSSSLACLPFINCYSDEHDLEERFSVVLEALIALVSSGSADVEIEKLIIYPWPKLLETLERGARCNPQLITETLIRRVQNLEDTESSKLAATFEAISKLGSLTPIDNNADIKTVVDWSYQYFEKIKVEFEADSLDYETELAYSFGNWLTSQAARIEKSNFDWRQVSESIKESISQEHVTVVFMVDALSQIHHKICEETLGTIENLSFQPGLVFAPLPTITKIGKKSVLTGLSPSRTSGSDLELLVNQYGNENLTTDNILILQDWKRASSNQLSKDTKLAVVYINELDDRLHKTSNFNKHTSDARAILNSIRKTIEKWLQIIYSLGKEVSFFVTADHGVTSLNQIMPNIFDGKAGERVVELATKPEKVPNDFYYLPSYSETAGYIVPKSRASFDRQCSLSHGGLTPEEVLIPFIQLSTVSNAKKRKDFEIENDFFECKIIADKEWKLQFNMKINCDLTDLHFKARQPFSGQVSFNVASRAAVLSIPLSLTSKHSQEGRTTITMTFRYKRDSQQVEQELDFDVDIPKPLLKQTKNSQNFGAMFDL